jgi:tRNA synthetases class I (E and Q), catalytic domain
MEIFENPVVGSRLVPGKLDACSRSGRDPELFPKADGRFAPSPTGPLHVGNLRTALSSPGCSRARRGDAFSYAWRTWIARASARAWRRPNSLTSEL